MALTMKETLDAICELESTTTAPSAKTRKAALQALAAYDPEKEKYIESLEAECKIYSDAAELYGIDAMTMLALARSQIRTCANNIRLSEQMDDYKELFSDLPRRLTEHDVVKAICSYDGNADMPYCDLVWAALVVVRKYLSVKEKSE